ncbi:MAG: HTH domain-containing protein [Erysipelothrix sp.]|nr:HTH domain-containing protein [Erysipelothrix sp.]
MSNSIKDKKVNYNVVEELLSLHYKEVEGEEFYRYIFPNNQEQGELLGNYSKPSAVYLYKDPKDEGTGRQLRRRIMLNDTWEEDYRDFVENNQMTLCSGLSYRGKTNRLAHAQHMNALVFDLDCVGKDELLTLFLRMGQEPGLRRLPQPTFLVMSGTGLHIYYVFDEPIELYPNIKLQLKKLKYDLTFKIWEYKATSQEKQIQYQSINQGFRMVGSVNNKYGLKVKAFKTGDRVSLSHINRYVDEKENMVDINRPFRPSEYTLEEAREKFPDWYQRVVVEKNRNQKKWHIKRDLYDWWLRQSHKIKGGHRYFYLMCMVIYAVKCDIPKDEVEEDMYEKFEELRKIEHSNPLLEEDIISALETYDRQYYNFKIDDIEKLTDIRIERNKRNYRRQDLHLRIARSTLDVMNEENGVALQGRPKGSGTKEELVKEYIRNNPDHSPTKIARNLGISRTTVYKYIYI